MLETHLVDHVPTSRIFFIKSHSVPLSNLSPSTHYEIMVEKLIETEAIDANCSTVFWTLPLAPEFLDKMIINRMKNEIISVWVPKIANSGTRSMRGVIAFVVVQEKGKVTEAYVQDLLNAKFGSRAALLHDGLFIAEIVTFHKLNHEQLVTIDEKLIPKLSDGMMYDLWYCVESTAGDKLKGHCKPVGVPDAVRTCEAIFISGKKPHHECSKFNTETIVGLTFLGIFIAVFFILLILLCTHWRRKTSNYSLREEPEQLIENIQKRSQDASMFHSNSHLMSDDRRNSSGSNYGDPFQNIHVEMTKAIDIEDFLKQGQMTDILLMEKFSHLPKNDLYQSEAGRREENVHLNRSILFLPYDKNRVQLPVTDSSATDYINASFVKVFQTRTYIVTEAPTTVTVQRFCSMVWHSNVERIVMLVDLEEITEPPRHVRLPRIRGIPRRALCPRLFM